MDNIISEVLHKGNITTRLYLRPLRSTDADDMFDYTSNNQTCKYLRWGPHTEVIQARYFISEVLNQYQNPFDIIWGIDLSNKLIGVIRIYKIDFKKRSAHISYILNSLYKGNGYMTEAINGVIQVCFESLNLQEIFAYCDQENKASYNTLKRCGLIETNISNYQEIKGFKRKILEFKMSKGGFIK